LNIELDQLKEYPKADNEPPPLNYSTMATSRRPENPLLPPNSSIPSSSPAFGTPKHPLNPRRTAPIRAPPALRPAVRTTVLPIELPPAILRPLAFRTFTKKHNITLTSSALAALAGFIGKHCGAGWREEGLAEKVLEEVAKSWKKSTSQVIVEGEGETLKGILKTLEGSMSGGRIAAGSSLGRQSSFTFGPDGNVPNVFNIGERPGIESNASFGMSKLEVEDKDEEEELLKDPREWMQVIGAFEQPKMVYNVNQRHFDKYVARSKRKYHLLTLSGSLERLPCSQTHLGGLMSSAKDTTLFTNEYYETRPSKLPPFPPHVQPP
jgi:DNA polymerase epsilon subunit 2